MSRSKKSDNQMTEGAFALLDCLGFKGIWNRTPPNEILSKLKELNNWCSGTINPGFEVLAPSCDHNLKIKIVLLSDTVAISIKYAERVEHAELPAFLVAYAVGLIILINQRFAFEKPCIPLRGSVSYGMHFTDDRFILGPAVDRAAENEKLADGAFIWLDPRAEELMSDYYAIANAVYEKFDFSKIRNYKEFSRQEKARKIGVVKAGAEPFTIDYSMPLKGGARLRCAVVNPLYHMSKKKQQNSLNDLFLAMDSQLIDVVVKKQNTFEYLNRAAEVTNHFWKTVKQFSRSSLKQS